MSNQEIIRKSAGVLIVDRKLLVSRSKGKDFFIAPGGKVEPGETDEQALIRELNEEFQITINLRDLEDFGTFSAPAAGNESKIVSMHCFMVKAWDGTLVPSHEIEEIQWVTSTLPEGLKLGSIFEHEVVPRLKSNNLIDE